MNKQIEYKIKEYQGDFIGIVAFLEPLGRDGWSVCHITEQKINSIQSQEYQATPDAVEGVIFKKNGTAGLSYNPQTNMSLVQIQEYVILLSRPAAEEDIQEPGINKHKTIKQIALETQGLLKMEAEAKPSEPKTKPYVIDIQYNPEVTPIQENSEATIPAPIPPFMDGAPIPADALEPQPVFDYMDEAVKNSFAKKTHVSDSIERSYNIIVGKGTEKLPRVVKVSNMPYYDSSSAVDISFVVPHNPSDESRKKNLLEMLCSLVAGVPPTGTVSEFKETTFQVIVGLDGCDSDYENPDNYLRKLVNELFDKLFKQPIVQSEFVKNFDITFVPMEKKGGWGYAVRNFAKNSRILIGRYVAFIDDDDSVEPFHPFNIKNHVTSNNRTLGRDMAILRFNTLIKNTLGHVNLRMSSGMRGSVGHSEMVINREVFNQLPDQSDQYGHDWDWHQAVARHNPLVRDVNNNDRTYIVNLNK